MNQKNYFLTTGLIFAIIGILHLLRVFYSWEAVIGNFEVPVWLSYIAIIISVILVYFACKFYNK